MNGHFTDIKVNNTYLLQPGNLIQFLPMDKANLVGLNVSYPTLKKNFEGCVVGVPFNHFFHLFILGL